MSSRLILSLFNVTMLVAALPALAQQPAENPTPEKAASAPGDGLKIILLKHCDAEEVAQAVSDIFGINVVTAVPRANLLVLRTDVKNLSHVEQLIQRLENESRERQEMERAKTVAVETTSAPSNRGTSPAPSPAPISQPASAALDLADPHVAAGPQSKEIQEARRRLNALEQEAAQLSSAARQQKSAGQLDDKARANLEKAVEKVFAARQQLQTLQIEQVRQRLDKVEETVKRRADLKERIVRRRVEDLLEQVDVQWNAELPVPDGGTVLRGGVPNATQPAASPVLPHPRATSASVNPLNPSSAPGPSTFMGAPVMADHFTVANAVAQAELAVKELDRAEKELALKTFLWQKDATDQGSVETAQADLELAKARLESAEASLERLRNQQALVRQQSEGRLRLLALDVEAAAANLENAQKRLQRAESTNRANSGVLPVSELDAIQFEVKKAELDLKKAKAIYELQVQAMKALDPK